MTRLFTLCILIFCALTSAQATTFDRVFVFGDSLSDIGNNQFVSHQYNNPNAQRGAPITNNVGTHRGTIWIQDIVRNPKQTFIQTHTIVASQHASQVDWKHHSIDFAWGSAKTTNSYSNNMGVNESFCQHPEQGVAFVCVPGLRVQVARYLQSSNVDVHALYILWAGGNDLFDNSGLLAFLLKDPWHNFGLRRSLSSHPADNVVLAADALVRAGVPSAHIVIFNLPDITQTPVAYTLLKSHSWLADLVRGEVRWFNARLALDIALQNNFLRHHFHLINTYPFLNDVIAHAAQFHLTHVHQQCILNPHALHDNCRGYLFYNGKHPSTQGGRILAAFVMRNLELIYHTNAM